jgi:uncharacterized protein (TIGR01777 family)
MSRRPESRIILSQKEGAAVKVVVGGGTGFLGRPLCELYAEAGHEVVVLSRSLAPGRSAHEAGSGIPGITRVGWQPDGRFGAWAQCLDQAKAVINLCGESIASGRWTPARKTRLRDSRVLATRSLAGAILAAGYPPDVFVSGSAVGYYGVSSEDRALDEQSPPSADFLGQVCVEWEREARRVVRPETRVVTVRTGIVLERDGGALAQMLLPFRLFAGGPIGSGRQYMSWIHRLDWVEMIRWIVDRPDVSGPINATAPVPVTNAEFSRALGRALGRPSWMRAPAFALRLALGEMADALVIGGQRVVPKRARELGFEFRYPEIDRAFRAIFEA